ncbi:MAG: hypothetical protein IJ912_06825 [Fibrobacter sp.]|nr:hypothetical protein [Fibrobacter sp.]
MKFAFPGFLFAIAMVNAASVWERSPWDKSPTEVKEQAQPAAVRQTVEAKPADPNTFIDSRDNQPYRTITVYGTTWMAENLNYEDRQSTCYEKKPHCKKDGRLYTWHLAQRVCPPGTRLPTTKDWEHALQADSFEHTLTNHTGFRAFNGDFYDYDNTGVYWAAEEKDDYTDYAYYFKWKFGSWQKKAFYKDQANSIRCIVEGSKTSGSHTWGDQ